MSGLLPAAPQLSVAEIVAVVLVAWFAVETAGIVAVNPSYSLGIPGRGEEYTLQEAAEYASQSLRLASITFAGLTFVVAQAGGESLGDLADPVYLFSVAFGFFLVAYKLEVFASERRIIYSTQTRMFNFGVLALVFGVSVYLAQSTPIPALAAVAVSAIVVAIHLYEYATDVIDYRAGNDVEEPDEQLVQKELNDY